MTNNIKNYCETLGLSQYDLAERTGIPRWKLQLFIKGRQEPTDSDIKIIRTVFVSRKKQIFQTLDDIDLGNIYE